MYATFDSCQVLNYASFTQQGPTVVRGAALSRALTAGKIFPHNIDDRVRNVLNLINIVQPSGIPENGHEKSNDTLEVKKFLREAASVRPVSPLWFDRRTMSSYFRSLLSYCLRTKLAFYPWILLPSNPLQSLVQTQRILSLAEEALQLFVVSIL